MALGNKLSRITLHGVLIALLGCTVEVFVISLQSCPGLFEACPNDSTHDICNGTTQYHFVDHYEPFTCKLTSSSTSESNSSACPEKRLTPPVTRGNAPNPGPCPNRTSRAMGQSPLDFKPLLLDLPFRPLAASSNGATGIPVCDLSANANVIIANPFTATVSRFYTCSQTTRASIPVAGLPLQVDVTPDTKLALVTNLTNSVVVIDTASNTVNSTIQFADSSVQSAGIAVTPDGARAYVTNYSATSPAVLAIDIAGRNVIAAIPVASNPLGVFITPDGSLAYVTSPSQNAIYVIDTLTNTVASTIGVVPAPNAVDFNPTGTLAYITSGTSPGTVQVLDTATYRVVKSYAVENQPIDVRVDPASGGRWVLVLNYASGSKSEIDTLTGKINTRATGETPHGLAFTR